MLNALTPIRSTGLGGIGDRAQGRFLECVIIAMACRIAAYEIELDINPAFLRANEVKLLQESREKLERVIGPFNMPPLQEALRWMIGS